MEGFTNSLRIQAFEKLHSGSIKTKYFTTAA